MHRELETQVDQDEAGGRVARVTGPVVFATHMHSAAMGDQVEVGPDRLIGEIIELNGHMATIQVYEDTTGLQPGMPVESTGRPLSVELGPGLLKSIYDGIQRPLTVLKDRGGYLIERGVQAEPLNREKAWHFVPSVQKGDRVSSLSILGTVQETDLIEHRIMVPHGLWGTVQFIAPEGNYTIETAIAQIQDDSEGIHPVMLFHRWPVRRNRPSFRRLPPNIPLLTGQRVLDFLFPIARGGAAAIPGGFGTGKTVTQHQLAKWSDADVIVYIGCGERGNEMAQVLKDFPELVDPTSGKPLMERTLLIANTSNMPVTAREASIYTGISMAEYYRDMGYDVAVMADSTSRWAEALREISGRLEEMPAEEGYPAYLSSRLAEFYERGGRAAITEDGREGSVSVIGAVSPQGGDFSEPVTQHTRRLIRAFWGLDKELAGARHFPSINWNTSYSEYISDIADWWTGQFELSWPALRTEALSILQEEARLQRVVQLIGPDALPDRQRLYLEIADLIKEGFLQQNAFDPVDAYCAPEKQLKMMDVILHFYRRASEVLNTGVPIVTVMDTPLVEQIIRMKNVISTDQLHQIDMLKEQVDHYMDELSHRYGQVAR